MTTHPLFLFTWSLALLAAPAPQDPAPAAAAAPSFEEIARGFCETNGIDADSPPMVDELLDGPLFVRLPIGGLDVRCPTALLSDPDGAELLCRVAPVLVGVQERWVDWRDAGAPGHEEVLEDFATLAKWVERWSPRGLAKVAKADPVDAESFYEELKAKKDVREALGRIEERLQPDEDTVFELGDGLHRVVLSPTREHFLGLVAFSGLVDYDERRRMWDDGLLGQSSAWFGWTQYVCLEMSEWPVDPSQPFAGRSFDVQSPTALEQTVADRAAAILVRTFFYRYGVHFFEAALVTNLVIDATGANDLYAEEWGGEWSSSGATSQPYTRFVPGGNPAGGTLPPKDPGPGIITQNFARIPLWRENSGSDHFAASLKTAQKAGAKLASKDRANPLHGDEHAHFELYSPETEEHVAVSAPFFGPAAEGKTLPPLEYLDDYEEFFRAYRSAFFHWMRGHGAEDGAAEKFAELIRRQARRSEDEGFPEIVAAVYGQPLSHTDGSTESLEWRFLTSIPRRKR